MTQWLTLCSMCLFFVVQLCIICVTHCVSTVRARFSLILFRLFVFRLGAFGWFCGCIVHTECNRHTTKNTHQKYNKLRLAKCQRTAALCAAILHIHITCYINSRGTLVAPVDVVVVVIIITRPNRANTTSTTRDLQSRRRQWRRCHRLATQHDDDASTLWRIHTLLCITCSVLCNSLCVLCASVAAGVVMTAPMTTTRMNTYQELRVLVLIA